MMKSPSRWFGQLAGGDVAGGVVWANADAAASIRKAADNARMIIDVLPVRTGPDRPNERRRFETGCNAKLRRFAVAGQARGEPRGEPERPGVPLPSATARKV